MRLLAGLKEAGRKLPKVVLFSYQGACSTPCTCSERTMDLLIVVGVRYVNIYRSHVKKGWIWLCR